MGILPRHFSFPNTYTIGWMAFTTVFPIATACTLVAIIGLIRKKVKTVFVEKYKILFIPIMIFLSLFQYYEYKYYLRYPEFLLETDYQTLQWFKKHIF